MNTEHLEMITEVKKAMLRSDYLADNEHLADQYLEPVQFTRDHGNPYDPFAFSFVNRYGHKLSLSRHSDGSVHFRIYIDN